jgi:hypothetical protein
LVTEVPESNERNAAGNGGVFSLLVGLAIGCALAGLLEFTRTFGAFGNLQFIPTAATEGMFVVWTWAMLASPVAVVASSIIVALGLAPTRAALAAASLSMIATLWMAARVWENVSGYLIVSDHGPDAVDSPLEPERWPFIYRHGVAVLICGVVIAVGAIGFALWRTRPRAAAFTLGLLLALLVVYLGGQFGLAPVAFLRLRNLSAVMVLLDLAVVVLTIRRRRFDAILILSFLLLAASAWQLDRSWRRMVIEMPKGIESPAL